MVFLVMIGSRDYMSYDIDSAWTTRLQAEKRLAAYRELQQDRLDDSEIREVELHGSQDGIA